MSHFFRRLLAYLKLIRFHRPIGTMLLLWPALWALWIAAEGEPGHLAAVFVLGAFLTRSAGCVINDIADRDLDGAVERTRERPLVTGEVAVPEALFLCAGLTLAAFILLLFTNALTILLSFAAVLLAGAYPYMKRHTHLPQLVLGAAFSWSVPMAFAAAQNNLPPSLWLLYIGNLLWTVAYDTQYAMADRRDDIKIGIKSTAILFGSWDRAMIAMLHGLALLALFLAGQRFGLSLPYYLGLLAAAGLFAIQSLMIRGRDPARCIRAFKHNNYVGLAVFAGILWHFS